MNALTALASCAGERRHVQRSLPFLSSALYRVPRLAATAGSETSSGALDAAGLDLGKSMMSDGGQQVLPSVDPAQRPALVVQHPDMPCRMTVPDMELGCQLVGLERNRLFNCRAAWLLVAPPILAYAAAAPRRPPPPDLPFSSRVPQQMKKDQLNAPVKWLYFTMCDVEPLG
jgi:hypothetical protein